MPVDPTTVTSLKSGDVATVVPLVTTMAKAYTRGRGFIGNEPNAEIAAVITTASARLSANSTGLQRRKVDDVEHHYSLEGLFGGWTLSEQIVLNRYRVRAQ